jgi:hypothetical protein
MLLDPRIAIRISRENQLIVHGEKSTTERSVSNSNSTVLIEMIGFDGPLLVRLEARAVEVLSLDAEPKLLLLSNLEARVGFEPTYRGFADLSSNLARQAAIRRRISTSR